MQDLVLHDECILTMIPTCVRTYFAQNKQVVQCMLDLLSHSSLDDAKSQELREYALRIFFRLY